MILKGRKIIQITPMTETAFRQAVLFALCDDGTVWTLPLKEGGKWMECPSLPDGVKTVAP
jgi:hypothetical protein